MALNIRHTLLQFGISLHFVLLLCIASLFMFGYEDAAGPLTDINIICVGYYWIFSIHQNTHLISKTSILLIALAILFVQLPNINYPPLLYFNVAILAAYLIFLLLKNDLDKAKIITCIFAIPVFFTLSNMLSMQNLALSTYARTAWDAAYIAAGIWVISSSKSEWIAKHGSKLIFTALLICTLILIQFPINKFVLLKPIDLFGFNLSMNAQIYSSFICIYAAATFMLALYFLVKSPWPLKIISLPILVSIALFILYVSWRPVMLGIMIGLSCSLLLCYQHKRRTILGGLILLLVILFASNIAHFRDRMTTLITQRSGDERVIVWQDTWKMQMDSPIKKWIIGHGLMSFKEDFKLYSRFSMHPESIHTPKSPPQRLWVYSQKFNDYLIHFRIYSDYVKTKKAIHPAAKKAVNWRSPHNLVLDVLYSSGLLGLTFICGFYFLTISHLAKLSHSSNKHRLLACLTMSALISNAIVNGLNFPFFLPFNLVPLAFICGTALYVHESSKQGV